MTLPTLPIPELPAELMPPIPELVHPFVVHFAIALPFLIILMELINLAVRKRTIGVLSFVYMVLLTLVLYAALLTGSTDGQAAKDSLDAATKALLSDHKQWAIYLFYASVLLMLFKLLSVLVRKTPLRVLFLIILFLFAAATLATGKRGGALVYEHGVNVGVKKSSAAAPAAAPAEEMKKEESAPAAAETSKEETSSAPAAEKPEASERTTEAPKKKEPAEVTIPTAEPKTESVTEKAVEAVETVKKEAEGAVEKAMDKAKEAVAPAEAPAPEQPVEAPHAQ
ncbi:DUF2231 domain-containing protein [Nitratifractor sp.]